MIPLSVLSDAQRKRINQIAFRCAFRLGNSEWIPPRIARALQGVAERVREAILPAGSIVLIEEGACSCRKSEGLSVGARLVVKRPVSGWFDYVMEYTPPETPHTWLGHYICPLSFRVIWVPADGIATRPEGVPA